MNSKRRNARFLYDFVIRNQSFRLENLHDLFSDATRRRIHRRFARAVAVSDSRQQVCNRVTLHSFSPTRLGHSRQHAFQCQFAQTNPANSEVSEIPARAPTNAAAVIRAHSELRFAFLFDYQTLLCHFDSYPSEGRPGILPRQSAASSLRRFLYSLMRDICSLCGSSS
jgi:hypothetical protein